jgi:hypothetical protein
MAAGVVRIADVVVPAIFGPYIQILTQEKSRIVRSGAISADAALAAVLAGGGLTFNEPSWKDLDNDPENVSSDDPAVFSSPNKIGTQTEIQVRMNRNNSWSTMDLTGDLAGSDPAFAIANRVSDYWVRRMQLAFIATLTGVFADNAAAPSGTDTHTINDLTHDVSGGAFLDGTTNFSAEAYLDTKVLMGDSMDQLSMVMMHSIVYNRALKNNLIDFIPDSTNQYAQAIPTFLGAMVIVDDGVTNAAGVFQTWLFGAGAFRWGNGTAKVPTEILRVPSAGNGGGQELMWSRVEWCIHPVGHAYIGTPPVGGPANAATANNLAAATSWSRVYKERKMIRIARLITREF